MCGEILTIGSLNLQIFDFDFIVNYQNHIAIWIIGGFLVGWGTRMGNGCTSGHGVCGMPRLAPRSIAAVCTFMATGFAIATFRYYVPFLQGGPNFGDEYLKIWRWIALVLIILCNLFVAFLVFKHQESRKELIFSYLLGALFGLGLLISGMCRVLKIQSFLIIGKVWDPSLIFVMLSAVAINFFTFKYVLGKDKPLYGAKFGVPARGVIDTRLLGGAAIFGLGWGLSGLCPGPGAICFFTMSEAILWVIALAAGQIAFDKVIEA